MYADFERFEIKMTRTQAGACSHPGPCDMDVAELVRNKGIARQLDAIGPDRIRIAAGNISDEIAA